MIAGDRLHQGSPQEPAQLANRPGQRCPLPGLRISFWSGHSSETNGRSASFRASEASVVGGSYRLLTAQSRVTAVSSDAGTVSNPSRVKMARLAGCRPRTRMRRHSRVASDPV